VAHIETAMSALGQKQTFDDVRRMSALTPESRHELVELLFFNERGKLNRATNVRFTPKSGHGCFGGLSLVFVLEVISASKPQKPNRHS